MTAQSFSREYILSGEEKTRGHRSCEKNVEKFRASTFPSLHHRKEGWPSDQKNIAKPPPTRGRGGLPIENKEENHPACVCFGGFAPFY